MPRRQINPSRSNRSDEGLPQLQPRPRPNYHSRLQNASAQAGRTIGNIDDVIAQEEAANAAPSTTSNGTLGGIKHHEEHPNTSGPAAIPSVGSSDQVGKGYTGPSTNAEDENEDKDKKKKGKFRGRLKKGGIMGGGGVLTTVIVAFVTFSPQSLLFSQVAQLTKGMEFANLDDSSDVTTWGLLRYAWYARQGKVEKTRMGFVGNKLADRSEKIVGSVGLKSTYTPAFGLIDGFTVDRENPDNVGKSDKELRKAYKEKFDIDLVSGDEFHNERLKGQLAIDARKLTYRQTRLLYERILKLAGLRSLTAKIDSRILIRRSGKVSKIFHPVQAKTEDAKRSFEDRLILQHRALDDTVQGESKASLTATSEPKNSEDDSQTEREATTKRAEAGKNAANELINEGQTAGSTDNAQAITRFQDSIHLKLALGGAGAAAVPCTLRSIAAQSHNIVQATVIAPAMRAAMVFISFGSQVESGEDFDDAALNVMAEQLSGLGLDGKLSTWIDAITMQAEAHLPLNGLEANETLRKIGKGTPFDFLNEGATGATLDVVCSSAVQNGIAVVSFIGGPYSTVASIAASMAFQPKLEHLAATWIAGKPLDTTEPGAPFGNILRYGARLAAGQQALASGGSVLSPDEEKAVRAAVSYEQQEEFQHKSIAYKLFYGGDYRTLAGHFVRSQSGDKFRDLASLGRSVMGISASFASNLTSVISGRAHAVTPTYDYPFPMIGFSQARQNDPRFKNPYENAEKVVDILEGPDGQKYIDKAKNCNGVSIAKDSDGLWDATSLDVTTSIEDQSKYDCINDTSEAWLRTLAFINGSTNASALACWELDDPRACSNVGFESSVPAVEGGTPVEGGGDTKALAQQILNNGNIRFQVEPAQRNLFKQVAEKGTQTACGGEVPISPTLLSVILKASEKYKLTLGVFAAGHPCDNGPHTKGLAVDMNGVSSLDGTIKTPNNQLHFNDLSFQQMAFVTTFYEYVASLWPEKVGGMGQYSTSCFSPDLPQKRTGVLYFPDSCDHLHIDARTNK